MEGPGVSMQRMQQRRFHALVRELEGDGSMEGDFNSTEKAFTAD